MGGFYCDICHEKSSIGVWNYTCHKSKYSVLLSLNLPNEINNLLLNYIGPIQCIGDCCDDCFAKLNECPICLVKYEKKQDILFYKKNIFYPHEYQHDFTYGYIEWSN